jgi:signal transduction histidine kinase
VDMIVDGARARSSPASGDDDALRRSAARWSWSVAAAGAAWAALFLLGGHLGSTTLAVAALPLPAVVAVGAGRAAGAHRRVLLVLVALPLATLLLAAVLRVRPETAAISAITVVSLTVPSWLVGRYARERQQLAVLGWNSSVAWEREAQLAATHARMLERSALAAQMHDLLGHELAKAALLVGALELDRSTDEKVRRAAGDARRGISNAADRLYDAVRALDATSDSAPDHLAARSLGNHTFELVAAGEAPSRIENLVNQARAAGQKIELRHALGAVRFSTCEPVTAGAVVAVVREGLTNAIKHSPGSPVHVTVDGRPDATAGYLLVRIDTDSRADGSDDADLSWNAAGTGRGLRTLQDGIEALGGTVRHGTSGSGLHRLEARVPRRPSRAITALADLGPEPSTVRQRRAEETVRRGGRQALIGVVGIAAGAVLLVSGLTVVNASTSLLPDSTFDTLQVGAPASEVAPLLPDRTRTEDPDTVPPPEGATCQYYSTRVNPLDRSADDLYRLCFRDGLLVSKDVLRPATGYVDPTSRLGNR